jgi:DNA-directed RNA polymerase specialized sigma24 family protein
MSLDLIRLDRALDDLIAASPRQARIVELRFFIGLTVEEAAQALSLSPATVKREWDAAKVWLYRRMERA